MVTFTVTQARRQRQNLIRRPVHHDFDVFQPRALTDSNKEIVPLRFDGSIRQQCLAIIV